MKLVKTGFDKTKVIVMDLILLQADVFEYVQAGVSGLILKDANTNEFFKTIRLVHDGVQVLSPDLIGSLFSQIISQALTVSKPSAIVDAVSMTKREKQVIESIAEGFTNKEIAQKLHLSPYTVKSHVHNILEKMALTTRLQIAKEANFAAAHKTAMDTASLIGE